MSSPQPAQNSRSADTTQTSNRKAPVVALAGFGVLAAVGIGFFMLARGGDYGG